MKISHFLQFLAPQLLSKRSIASQCSEWLIKHLLSIFLLSLHTKSRVRILTVNLKHVFFFAAAPKHPLKSLFMWWWCMHVVWMPNIYPLWTLWIDDVIKIVFSWFIKFRVNCGNCIILREMKHEKSANSHSLLCCRDVIGRVEWHWSNFTQKSLSSVKNLTDLMGNCYRYWKLQFLNFFEVFSSKKLYKKVDNARRINEFVGVASRAFEMIIFSSLNRTSFVSLTWKLRGDENDQASIDDLKFH